MPANTVVHRLRCDSPSWCRAKTAPIPLRAAHREVRFVAGHPAEGTAVEGRPAAGIEVEIPEADIAADHPGEVLAVDSREEAAPRQGGDGANRSSV